jgi:hypothetical protein
MLTFFYIVLFFCFLRYMMIVLDRQPAQLYCCGRLDSHEVNLGEDVEVVGLSRKPIAGLFSIANPPARSRTVTKETVSNRQPPGTLGRIVSFDRHGAVRLVQHDDGTTGAYHAHELSFSQRHYDRLRGVTPQTDGS